MAERICLLTFIPQNAKDNWRVKTTDSCGHPIIPTQITLRYRLSNDAVCKEVLSK